MFLFCRIKSSLFAVMATVVMLAQPLNNARASEQFDVAATFANEPDALKQIQVQIKVPAKHYLYADTIKIQSTNASLTSLNAPEPEKKTDANSGDTVLMYTQDVQFIYAVTGSIPDSIDIFVSYQGCNDTTCFLPVSKTITLETNGKISEEKQSRTDKKQAQPDGWKDTADNFTVSSSETGYMEAREFIEFLNSAREKRGGDDTGWQSVLEQKGWLIASVLILIAGLALNLTPCVLPMIPINLAIIGAGTQAASKGKGLVLGTFYGAGMAMVYGALGLTVALTNAKFGELNASPWFNATIAVLFIMLALGMFGIFNIDLSRFQSKTSLVRTKSAGFVLAFFMGGIMALLAGSCVAPVMISVLLFSTQLYAEGNSYGLFMPFLLGIGMALPWPLAGAGLAILPKPGKWMNYIKYAFGVIILGFAVYYGHLSIRLLMNHSSDPGQATEQAEHHGVNEGWHSSLVAGLAVAEKNNQPVLIDLWAISCKSCMLMEKTTLKDPEVVAAMKPFVKIKFRADNFNDPHVSEVLDYFDVLGLPTYVVLQP